MPTDTTTAHVTVYGPRAVSNNRHTLRTTTGELTQKINSFHYKPTDKDNSPHTAFLLAPGEAPQHVRLNELHKHPIGLGVHLLLPATKDHEDQLNKFLKSLEHFPPDIEGSIVNVLRSPDFEFRLTHLEQTVEPSAQPIPDEHSVRASPSSRSNADWTWVEAGLVGVLCGLIILGGWFYGERAVTWLTGSSNDEAPLETFVREPAQPSQQAELSYERIKQTLRNELRETSATKRWLAEDHFAGWLSPADPKDTLSYANGLIALALAANNPDFNGLPHADESSLEEALAAARGGETYPQFEMKPADRLLTFAFCGVDPSSTEAVFQTQDGNEIRFTTETDCTTDTSDDENAAARQLEQLVAWLQENPTPAEEILPDEPGPEGTTADDAGPQD